MPSTMNVLLAFPPHWAPVMPHLALPTLTAFLRAQGARVVQRDLSVETFDAVLTQGYLEATLATLTQSPGVSWSRGEAALIA
ncbi:MAG: hypothetical protein JXC32_08820, partial [Anaerolineae bacterium]|nr:hypothetical protein [Anaerolineae bacterium]